MGEGRLRQYTSINLTVHQQPDTFVTQRVKVPTCTFGAVHMSGCNDFEEYPFFLIVCHRPGACPEPFKGALLAYSSLPPFGDDATTFLRYPANGSSIRTLTLFSFWEQSVRFQKSSLCTPLSFMVNILPFRCVITDFENARLFKTGCLIAILALSNSSSARQQISVLQK